MVWVAWFFSMQGESPVAEICMLKNQATQTMAFCASEAVQIFGGAGYMRGIKVERIYREVKVNAIGGGTQEIMKDLASRQMGLCYSVMARLVPGIHVFVGLTSLKRGWRGEAPPQ